MKLRIAITCLSACLLPAPALRAQDSPRVACYDPTVTRLSGTSIRTVRS